MLRFKIGNVDKTELGVVVLAKRIFALGVAVVPDNYSNTSNPKPMSKPPGAAEDVCADDVGATGVYPTVISSVLHVGGVREIA